MKSILIGFLAGCLFSVLFVRVKSWRAWRNQEAAWLAQIEQSERLKGGAQ